MRRFIQSVVNGFVDSKDAEDIGLSEPSLSIATYAASAVINTLALALPITILQIYDRVLPNEAFDTLTALILVLIGVIFVDGLLKYFRSAVINWSAASFTHNLSVKALSTMLSSRPSQFNRVTASEHLERLNSISGLGGYLGGQSRVVAVDILFITYICGSNRFCWRLGSSHCFGAVFYLWVFGVKAHRDAQ